MGVTSYLSLYTSVFGWYLYDQVWAILAQTGLVFLPFLALVLKNAFEPQLSQQPRAASSTSLRRMEIGFFAMGLVIVLAGVPALQLTPTALTYTRPSSALSCAPGGSSVTGGASGTTYDPVFNETTLGGAPARVPLIWYAVMAISGGLDNATIAAIPCHADLRAIQYGLARSRIHDGPLRQETQHFIQACFVPARSDFLAKHLSVPASYAANDTQWPGSKFFQDTPGYYDTYRPARPVHGFAFDPSRDKSFDDPSIPQPTWGRPTCYQWWNGTNATNGLKTRLLSQVDPGALTKIRQWLPGALGITRQQADDLTLQRLFTRERGTGLFTGDAQQFTGGYTSNEGASGFFGAIYNDVTGRLGSAWEKLTFYPKVNMIRQAAPIVQSLLLMFIYMLLPYVLIFSGFGVRTAVFMAAVIFAIYYWTPLWAITYWLDNNLMDAMAPAALVTGEPYLTGDIMSFVTGGLYLVVPFVWLTLLGWSGYQVGGAVASLVDAQTKTAQAAGTTGGGMVRNFGARAVKHFKA